MATKAFIFKRAIAKILFRKIQLKKHKVTFRHHAYEDVSACLYRCLERRWPNTEQHAHGHEHSSRKNSSRLTWYWHREQDKIITANGVFSLSVPSPAFWPTVRFTKQEINYHLRAKLLILERKSNLLHVFLYPVSKVADSCLNCVSLLVAVIFLGAESL